MTSTKKYLAEGFGTAVLVLMGCGSAVLAGSVLGGTLGIAFGFGLSVVAMAYTIGHISGCHINPAVTVGMWAAGRMKGHEAVMYVIAQVIGAIIGALLLSFIASGNWTSPELGQNVVMPGYTVLQAFVAEFVATMIFVRVILGSTSTNAITGNLAGLVIGLTLVLIHIVFIPVTGTSVNPARSFGPALLVGGAAWSQLWLFWVAPLLGAMAAAWAYQTCESGSHK